MFYLILDDCLEILAYMADLFKSLNLAAKTSSDCAEAIEIIKNCGQHEITIIVDLILGNKSGLDFSRELRAMGVECRIILMSGKTIKTKHLLDEMEALKIQYFLSKPIDLFALNRFVL